MVKWVDLFTRPVYRDIVIDSIRYAIEHKGCQLFAYVVMSNHVHLVAQSSNGDLSCTIRDIKKYTSKRIIETIQSIPEGRRDWMMSVFSHAASQHQRNTDCQVWTRMKAMLLFCIQTPLRLKRSMTSIKIRSVRCR
ncbi:transposase IS200 family protein [Breznakibacter xylanolyticus]|uniref:Transposase IS200 family protein n=1 Tax=Breznakibacter xylanolyticus TaxID=990 RepID=A0A2W7NIK7_9BACT|nr:transposase [Breznakibacter xylanolyticus]PZX17957.1 transposase IS200 family protein [Breznakibacter xylanolyticus]